MMTAGAQRFSAQRYQKTQTSTASKERLMVLLFQAGLRKMNEAINHFEHKDFINGSTSLYRASDIVWELQSTLDHEQAPELCAQIDDVYAFVNAKLTAATASRNPDHIKEAIRVYEPLVKAFEDAVGKVAAGA